MQGVGSVGASGVQKELRAVGHVTADNGDFHSYIRPSELQRARDGINTKELSHSESLRLGAVACLLKAHLASGHVPSA